jgi:hypothetical protein
MYNYMTYITVTTTTYIRKKYEFNEERSASIFSLKDKCNFAEFVVLISLIIFNFLMWADGLYFLPL